MPVLAIAAILAVVGAVGFGASNGASQEQTRQEVTELLADIPQHGVTLGSPKAPITARMFADLECPTVRRFIVSYLPAIVSTWVRDGELKLEYRSLQTDTADEHTFFEQEAAALAAGRQRRMWNFVLTFVHEQGQKGTDYATEEFFADIASQVPGLNLAQWRHDRMDPLLSRQVALSVHSAHARDSRSTPSFLLDFTGGKRTQDVSSKTASIWEEVESSLRKDVQSLDEEASGDVPTLGIFDLAKRD